MSSSRILAGKERTLAPTRKGPARIVTPYTKESACKTAFGDHSDAKRRQME